ncbi:hypothetical protein R3W88_033240 [Solanum pinnatisectum]|uniref:Uncharacterized protein n=1 Tax=Solanum pinnatisectum TaxID=50273 RepID=A0AAV9K3T8_9SOLN|nr:hypothetical protein R3W88_033240 [Solanum pinnatisectum]
MGIIHVVLVIIKHISVAVYFVILDVVSEREVPIVLGKTIPFHWARPFLFTGKDLFKYTRKRRELGIKWGKGDAQCASSYEVAY